MCSACPRLSGLPFRCIRCGLAACTMAACRACEPHGPVAGWFHGCCQRGACSAAEIQASLQEISGSPAVTVKPERYRAQEGLPALDLARNRCEPAQAPPRCASLCQFEMRYDDQSCTPDPLARPLSDRVDPDSLPFHVVIRHWMQKSQQLQSRLRAAFRRSSKDNSNDIDLQNPVASAAAYASAGGGT